MDERVRFPRSLCLLLVTMALASMAWLGGSRAEAAGPPSELTVAFAQDFAALDPRKLGSAASFSMLRHVYEPLVWYREDAKLYGVLAESWQVVDPLTTRFKLRKGVTFTNGKPFNAEVVKFSLAQVTDPNFPFWGRFALRGVIKGATVIDDVTVDVITERPVALSSLLNRLTIVDMVEPSHATTPAMDSRPMGTGPYKFIEFIPRQSFKLERNASYWGPAPKIEKITARIVPEAATRVAALQNGEVQLINTIPPEALPRIRANNALAITTGPSLRHIFVELRGDRKPLDKVEVRQALNYAVDKTAIVNTIVKDLAVVSRSLPAPLLFGARTDLGPYPYDPAKAKALLAQAGYAGEPITLAVGQGRYPNDAQVAEAIVNFLKQVGVNVKLVTTEFATLSSEISKGKDSPFDAFFYGWSPVPPEPVLGLSSMVYSKGNTPRFYYVSPKVDELVEKAAVTTDENELKSLLGQVQEIVWREAPFIFLYHPVETLALSKRLKGFQPRPDEFYFFQNASLE